MSDFIPSSKISIDADSFPHTDLINIDNDPKCKTDKYLAQEILPDLISSNYNIYNVQFRTGTGKTRIPCILKDTIDYLGYQRSVIVVPNQKKSILTQHIDTFITYFDEACRSDVYQVVDSDGKITEYSCRINQHTFIFTSYPGNTSNLSIIEDWFNKHTENGNYRCMFYMDEFHEIQTQFGLYHHGKSSAINGKEDIRNYINYHKKFRGTNIFERYFSKDSPHGLLTMSATMSDTIMNDLLPYYQTHAIKNIVCILKNKYYDIPIKYIKGEDGMYDKIKHHYLKRDKMYIYAKHTTHSRCIYNLLIRKDINHNDIYRSDCKTGEKFDITKTKQKLVCIFVMHGTTGVDDPDLKAVFVMRKLSNRGSSGLDMDRKNSCAFSNIAQQIAGRLRHNYGIVYWLTDADQEDTDLFSRINQYYTQFTEASEIALFKKKLLFTQIAQGLIFRNNLERFQLVPAITLKCFHDTWINKKPTSSFGELLKGLHGIISDEKVNEWIHVPESYDIDQIKRLVTTCIQCIIEHTPNLSTIPNYDNQHTSNCTGGGTSKPNISDAQKKIGYKILSISTKHIDGGGLSAFRKPNPEIEFSYEKRNEFIHIKNKKDLPIHERHKSKYAIPAACLYDHLINYCDGENDHLLYMDQVTGKPVLNKYNFEAETEIFGLDGRRELDKIQDILEHYHKLHKDIENKSYNESNKYLDDLLSKM